MADNETTDEVEKTYTFDELSPQAQEAAIEERKQGDYLNYNWWDGVYEDFLTIMDRLGFYLESKDIWFQVSYSQGDAAGFKASYRGKLTAITELQQYAPHDEELYRIASELTAMQVTQRILGLELFNASVEIRERSFDVVDIHDWGIDEVGEPDEKRFKKAVQNLAYWLYTTLRDELEYLTSDEQVREELKGGWFEFTEEGLIL